jgi:hypothetical protein
MRTQLRTTLVLIAVLALGLPAAAHASAADVIRDCAQDGKLDKTYTQKELQAALRDLPSDINEYTDCAATIRAAMHGGSGNPSGPGGTGAAGPAAPIVTASGAVAASPQDVQALAAVQAAAKHNAPAVTIGGKKVTPGNAGLSGPLAGLAAANTMPPSLLTVLVLLVALAIVTTFLAARDKLPALRGVTARLFRR